MIVSIERKITLISYKFIIGDFKSLASYKEVFFYDQLCVYYL